MSPSRRRVGLLVLALPCVVYAMDLSVVDLALPALTSDLHPSGTQLLWIADVYGFMVAGALVTMGTLGDRIGRRKLLLIGAAMFSVASLVAYVAPSANALIAARAAQGIAGATIAPSTLALITTLFPDPAQRTRAIGAWIAAFSVGGAIGPVVGGAIVQAAPWNAIFLPAIPVMAVVLVLGPRVLPEDTAADAGRLDVRSAALSLLAVLAGILAIKQLVEGSTAVAAAAGVASVALGLTFVTRQRVLADPLIDLRLFADAAFSGVLLANLAGFAVLFGVELFLAQALQSALGLSPLVAGVAMLPGALGFVAGSLMTGALVDRAPRECVFAGGLLVAAAGMAAVALTGSLGLAAAVGGSTLASLGLAPVFTLAADLITGAAPAERQGMAAGISETSSELGGALGIALLGSLGTAVFRARSGLDTIGAHPTSAAGDAFLGTLTIVAALSAVLLVAAAVAAHRALGPRPVAACATPA